MGEGISAYVEGTDPDPNSVGLQFQCNYNQGNATNLMSRIAEGDADFEFLHTIRGIQGRPEAPNITELAAGNRFDQNTTWDFDKNTEGVANIFYYYDPAFADQEPQNHPADVQPIPITGTGNACGDGPGVIGGGHTIANLKPVLQSNKYAYGSIRYLYEQLIDGGNTDEVVQEITDAWPQDIWDLRTYLLGKSPYLSVQVLKQLIDKVSVPVAIKMEICVANPEGTQKDGFLKWAELESQYPLPAYAIASIKASWNTKTYRFSLEAQMADKHANMTQAANHLLFLYRADSTHADPDSLRWVWQQLRTNAARYAETGLLLKQERYADALDVLDAMPTEKALRPKEQTERQRMLAYVDLLATAHSDGRSAYRLNGQEVQQLDELVGELYDRPAVWASNLLCAVYGICRPPYTGGAPTAKSLRTDPVSENASSATPGLLLQPNPASTYVAINYNLPGNTGTAQLRIRDASGREVRTLQVAGEQGQQVWDTRGTAPGVYAVELLREGRLVHSERLVLQP